MEIQKNTLVIIIVILILFIISGAYFCFKENEKITKQLLTSVLQPKAGKEKVEEEFLVPTTFAPGRLLVRFKDNVPEDRQKKLIKDWGFELKDEIKQIKVKIINVPEQAEEALAKALSKNPNIDYAELDYVAEAMFTPNDPWFVNQQGMVRVQAPQAWDVTTGSASINIAILDTGVDLDHPDLASKLVAIKNFTGSSTADDVHGHGTHVAGIAAAITNNGVGVAGLGYSATIMNVKVLGDDGKGYWSWVAQGIVWAADNGAEVINLSLGGSSGSSTLESAINYAWNKGVVIVAAAGNNGNSAPFYPAYYSNCVAVAAIDSVDRLASWSNYGDWVDVAAPGVSIYSTLKEGGYGYKSGTSMASPHVAGLAGLVFTVVSDTNGDGKLNNEVRSRIENTCDDIDITGIGSGRINAYKAVGASTSTTPTPPPDITPPTVSITSPSNNSTVSGTISVNVTASDNVAVSKVELYKDGVFFATDDTSPYSFVWDTTKDTNGNHKLEAKAYDTSQNTAVSSITVNVNNQKDTTPPTVNIITPQDGETVPAKGKILIEVTAKDDTKVTQIDILVDNRLITSCYNSDSCFNNFTTTKLKSGTHTITAKAYDSQSNIGQASITIKK